MIRPNLSPSKDKRLVEPPSSSEKKTEGTNNWSFREQTTVAQHTASRFMDTYTVNHSFQPQQNQHQISRAAIDSETSQYFAVSISGAKVAPKITK
jgi:hypothetical protein